MKVPTDKSRDNIRALSSELEELTKHQYEALQKSSYIKMSQAESVAYDARRVRIAEVCKLLANFRTEVS